MPSSLARSWEGSAALRLRFRKNISWLQWPLPKFKPEGKTRQADPHLPCTRAVELNVEALDRMLDFFQGEFVDIDRLEKEAF